MRIFRFAAILLALLAGLEPVRAQDAPRIVATIPPVHALVAMVSEGVSEPALIMEPGASLHHFALRPSHARAIQDADIIFRIGPMTELWAETVLAAAAGPTVIVTLAETEGTILLEARRKGLWNGERGVALAATTDDPARIDPHLWLDPENAQVWLHAMARELAALDPAHAEIYLGNAREAAQRIAALQARIVADLMRVRQAPYIVFHDAYQYFEERFGLAPAGALALSDARKPGVAHIKAVRRQIAQLGVACVFTEPQFNATLVQTVIEGTGARAGILDPIGTELEPGPALYPALLEDLSVSLIGCLSAGKS